MHTEKNTIFEDFDAHDTGRLRDDICTLLRVAQGEAQLAGKDGNQAVNTLTATFTKMVRDIFDVKLAARDLRCANPQAQQQLLAGCEAALDKAQSAIVGFQFYDKLMQRLDHITNSLKALTQQLNGADAVDPAAWNAIKKGIYGSYTMEEDRILFKAIVDGLPVDSAMRMSQEGKASAEEDRVEFF